MSVQTMTLNEVRLRGLGALKRELGVSGTIRFVQQFCSGHGNYSEDRHQWLDDLDLETVIGEIRRKQRKARKA